MTSLQTIAMMIALGAGTLLASASLTWQIIPGALPRFGPSAALTISAAAFAIASVALFPWQTSGAFVADGTYCLGVGSSLAVLAGAVFSWLTRRGAPLGLCRLGATVGGIAGLVAVTILQFSCSRQETSHLVVWHGGVLVIAIAAGILIGRLLEAVTALILRRPVAGA